MLDILANSAISLIHTFVNIPALIRKRSVFLSRRAEIFTKVVIGDIGPDILVPPPVQILTSAAAELV
jgi:hypothetical protein